MAYGLKACSCHPLSWVTNLLNSFAVYVVWSVKLLLTFSYKGIEIEVPFEVIKEGCRDWNWHQLQISMSTKLSLGTWFYHILHKVSIGIKFQLKLLDLSVSLLLYRPWKAKKSSEMHAQAQIHNIFLHILTKGQMWRATTWQPLKNSVAHCTE